MWVLRTTPVALSSARPLHHPDEVGTHGFARPEVDGPPSPSRFHGSRLRRDDGTAGGDDCRCRTLLLRVSAPPRESNFLQAGASPTTSGRMASSSSAVSYTHLTLPTSLRV